MIYRMWNEKHKLCGNAGLFYMKCLRMLVWSWASGNQSPLGAVGHLSVVRMHSLCHGLGPQCICKICKRHVDTKFRKRTRVR